MPVPTSVARKRRIEVAVGKYFANPLVTGLNRIGLMPSLMTEIETVGRRTGLTRRVPVAITYDGDEAWVIAQHGIDTGWGANISATPKVRIRRRGEWVDGQAQIMPDDDVPARVKTFASGKIRSALTASAFRGLQTDPVSVRIKLALDSSTD